MSGPEVPGEVRQEPLTFRFRALIITGIISLVVVVIGIGIAALILGLSVERRTFVEPPTPRPPPPGELGIFYDDIEATAEGIRRHVLARRALESYGWVDRERGIAHVPIEVAMEMVLREAPAPGPEELGPGGPEDIEPVRGVETPGPVPGPDIDPREPTAPGGGVPSRGGPEEER